ncbi:hypothetical protein LCGC14_3125620 [marine sediment metagenome]|uniref:Uncharacterized protein n=1 Tax=marine sediment metagenome TaxID=412755 RepID=A0A0F8W197_9ZZZZ
MELCSREDKMTENVILVDENDNNVFKLENLKIVFKKTVIYFGIWNVDFYKFKKKIKYVHQLQNICFALTGKELTKQ